MPVRRELVHLPLPHRQIIEMQKLASIADTAQISGGILDLPVDFLKDDGQFLER